MGNLAEISEPKVYLFEQIQVNLFEQVQVYHFE